MAVLRQPRLWAGVASACLAIALVAPMPPLRAQPIAASALKAAFMLNFVKFAEWPARPPDLPVLLCVSGNDTITADLRRGAAGQSVDGRPVAVAQVDSGKAAQNCQLLFIGDRDTRVRATLLVDIGELPVLTVSDAERSPVPGVMIAFFLEKDRLRFAVNLDALERGRIKLSSRLLVLAVVVRDDVPRSQAVDRLP